MAGKRFGISSVRVALAAAGVGFLVASCAPDGSPGLSGDEPAAETMSGSVVQGQQTAERWCATCHAVSEGTRPGVDAGAPSFSAMANAPGVDRDSLFRFMNETHPVHGLGADPIEMPTNVLYEREKADVVAYILSLREEDE